MSDKCIREASTAQHSSHEKSKNVELSQLARDLLLGIGTHPRRLRIDCRVLNDASICEWCHPILFSFFSPSSGKEWFRLALEVVKDVQGDDQDQGQD